MFTNINYYKNSIIMTKIRNSGTNRKGGAYIVISI